MDKMQMIRFVTRIIVSTAVSSFVGGIVKANMPTDLTTTQKIVFRTGQVVVTSMIADKGADYVDGIIATQLQSVSGEKPQENKPEEK